MWANDQEQVKLRLSPSVMIINEGRKPSFPNRPKQQTVGGGLLGESQTRTALTAWRNNGKRAENHAFQNRPKQQTVGGGLLGESQTRTALHSLHDGITVKFIKKFKTRLGVDKVKPKEWIKIVKNGNT